MLGWNLHDRKLVPAQTGHDVFAADATAHAFGRRLQQPVTDGMSERVVDVLEMVEIEAEHRDGFGASQAAQDRSHPLVERHTVRQVCERIVMRQVPDPFLGEKSLGDVLEGGNEAAVRHRPV